VLVDKSINLFGEDKNTTIIDGEQNGDVVTITADWINISGFTIRNSGTSHPWHSGIKIIESSHCVISYNILAFNAEGIHIGGDFSPIEFNNYNIITKNIFKYNYHGYGFSGCGINICHSYYTKVFENQIEKNHIGISITYSFFSNISKNNIELNSDIGLSICENAKSSDINKNNFIGNGKCATFLRLFLFPPPFHRWSRNYWDDHNGIGPKMILGRLWYTLSIPWIAFDWNPAKEPYDIDI